MRWSSLLGAWPEQGKCVGFSSSWWGKIIGNTACTSQEWYLPALFSPKEKWGLPPARRLHWRPHQPQCDVVYKFENVPSLRAELLFPGRGMCPQIAPNLCLLRESVSEIARGCTVAWLCEKVSRKASATPRHSSSFFPLTSTQPSPSSNLMPASTIISWSMSTSTLRRSECPRDVARKSNTLGGVIPPTFQVPSRASAPWG